jgi:hypothetical protein
MAGAFLYADAPADNPIPAELDMLWLIDRFGWDAAHHAPAKELRRMILAENVYRAYKGREAADGEGGWVECAEHNPQAAKILARAEIITNREE